MTVSYHSSYSSTRFFGQLSLLTRWRGSVYKLLYREFLLYFASYAVVSLVYRFALNDELQKYGSDVVTLLKHALHVHITDTLVCDRKLQFFKLFKLRCIICVDN